MWSIASADVQYVYDAAGRLVQVIAPDGSLARYQYDPAGNILAIDRLDASTVSISAVSPGVGSPGTTVTIWGSGFSTTPDQNTVAFNSVSTVVSAATANSLVVTVPNGATTGPVTVTAPGGSASSPQSFIVTTRLEISGFTPTIGAAGTAVTITGAGFDATAANNAVHFNNTNAAVTVASSTQLQTVVPSGAASGRITVGTPTAIAVSANDFIIPPGSYTSADIDATGRMAPGTAGQTVEVSGAGKIAVYLFDGVQGQNYSLLFTGVTLSGGTFAVYRPNGAVLLSGSITNNSVFDLPVLPTTGTYSVVIAAGSTTGSVTVKLLPAATGVAKTDGTPVSLPLAAGQNAALTFTGAAGQHYSLVLTNYSSVPTGGTVAATIVRPDGTTSSCGTFSSATSGNCDFSTPSNGTYTLQLNPSGAAAISFNVVISADLNGGPITLNAAPITYNAVIPGQNIRYTFEGSAGQNITAVYSGNTIAQGTIYFYKPDGTRLTSSFFNGTSSGYLDMTLPSAGTYEFVVYVDAASTGWINVGLVIDAPGIIAIDGTPLQLSLTAGQNASLTFEGIAGQGYSLAITGLATTPSGNSVTVSYEYDAGDRLTQISQGTVTVSFEYDSTNRRTSLTLPNGIKTSYAYDEASQLTGITYKKGGTQIGNLTYAYDAAGRRTGMGGSLARVVLPSAVSSASYDETNRLTTWGGTGLNYDDDGNLISAGSSTYAWNARNELVSTSDGGGTFSYDALGRRASRTISGTTTTYLHDGLNPVRVNNDFLLAGSGLDEFYAHVASSGTTSYLTDALGSTLALTDGSGTATANYSYQPYGAASKTGSQDTSFQFTGRENDDDSKLMYFRARYYASQFGRFISEDPIGLVGGINLHVYAEGDPISRTDPLGQEVLFGGSWLEWMTRITRPVEGTKAPPAETPRPPGYNEEWVYRPSEGSSEKASDWRYSDPEGGEWRYAPPDRWHQPHWDYNPWRSWNDAWKNVEQNGQYRLFSGLPPYASGDNGYQCTL